MCLRRDSERAGVVALRDDVIECVVSNSGGPVDAARSARICLARQIAVVVVPVTDRAALGIGGGSQAREGVVAKAAGIAIRFGRNSRFSRKREECGARFRV